MARLETLPQTLFQDQVFSGTTKLLTNYIICLVGGLSRKYLWDTGSSVSVIRKGKFDALRENTDIVIEKADIPNVLGAACKRVPVHGMVELEVQIGDYIAHQRFYVLDSVPQAAILGLDFMKINHAVTSMDTMTVSLWNGMSCVAII